MKSTHKNHLNSLLSCAWRKKKELCLIVTTSFALAMLIYTSQFRYIAKGILLIQKAQNSSLQELSAGLGRMSAEGFSPFSKDLYIEKFIMYLNSRDYFLEVSKSLQNHASYADFEAELKLSEEPHSFPDSQMDGFTSNHTNILATKISKMTKIVNNGSLGIDITTTTKNPLLSITLTNILIDQAKAFITSRELKELDAAKDYLLQNLTDIEQRLQTIFEQQISEIRKSPEIQEASRASLLEKIARISGELEKQRTALRKNDLILDALNSAKSEETSQLKNEVAILPGRFKVAGDALKDHAEALMKRRSNYLSAGIDAQSKIITDLDAEIARAKSEAAKALASDAALSSTHTLADVPISDQIAILEKENFGLRQSIKALQISMKDILKEGISHALSEQQSVGLLKRAEIQYELFTEITKQLFAVDVQRISVKNKVMEIERPSIETIEMRPGFAVSMILGLMMSVALSYFYLVYVDKTDPMISSWHDAQDLGAKILGSIPSLRPTPSHNWSTSGLEINHSVDTPASIVFKNIRTRIVQKHQKDARTSSVFLITSSQTNEGKSFFSLNIAASLGQAGFKTIVIDTDARKQGLTKTLRMTATNGLLDILTGSSTSDQVIRSLPEGFDVITAGRFRENTSELLLNHQLEDLLSQLKQKYEFVIMDTAPVLIIGDALNILDKVDMVAVVVRPGASRISDFSRTLDAVSEGGKDPLVVMNRTGDVGSYYYGPMRRRTDRDGDSTATLRKAS